MLEIKIIQTPEELEQLEPIYIERQLWGTTNMPVTYAKIGFILQDGFYVKMVCMEKNPCRTLKEHRSPVCQDSAMEIFMQFPEHSREYINFELNANGAILTAHGDGRDNRQFFSEEEVEAMHICAEILEDRWMVSYRIPEKSLIGVCPTMKFEKGSTFLINFFKVCEGRTPCEFGSYVDIPLEHPSFHEPQFFETGILV